MKNKLIDQYASNEISYSEFSEQASSLQEEKLLYDKIGLTPSEYELFQRLGQEALDQILLARTKKAEIIQKWKKFFREEIAASHQKNTLKLANLKHFNLNPFLDNYKANFLTGDNSAKSKAAALVYARALGPSINTTFGTQLQRFCSDILSGYASTTSGIDIEFIDFVDGRRKYCQIKAGPNTINKDDVQTITDHFSGVKNLARTNNLNIGFNDLVVGIFYGDKGDLSNHYKKIQKDYPVLIGQDFWYRLTGDPDFYNGLTQAIDEVANEFDGRELLESVINQLADKIEKAED